jgi:inner membrane protein
VSPIGLERFLSQRGVEVLRSELVWVWLPAIGLVTITALVRRGR